MNILALNTANIMADIVVLAKEKQILKKVNSLAKHSESFMPALDEILFENNLKISNFDAVAVVVGPGSFTGIRIGVALAKGFEMANPDLKLISLTSFELMAKEFLANNPTFKGQFVCVINALSGKFYAQKFSTEAKFFEPELLEGTLKFESEKVVVGDRAENLEFCTDFVVFETEVLKTVVLEKAQKQEFVSDLVPLYLRKSQAEDELEKKEKKANE